ncbi:efflux RND transporter periplasmic adaptor subunit [Planktothrix sp.]|uniref:efflux RND transporter periplasmic adaptor subunit n=1 Tax=Planktothrix sp. TaxID=3088171 RepID=UPI0038D4730C
MQQHSAFWKSYFSLILGSILMTGCGSEPQAATVPPVSVNIAPVGASNVKNSSIYNARVEGVQNAIIQPRVNGLVKQVYVRLGDRVSPNSPLIQIDARQQQANYESQLASVESRIAQLNSARANLDSQRAELARIQAELTYQSQEADLEDAQQTLAAEEKEKQRLEYELEFTSAADELKTAQENVQVGIKERERRRAIMEERKKAYDRYQPLYQQGVISAELYDEKLRDYEATQADFAAQEREILSLQAKVRTAQQNLERQTSTLTTQIEGQQRRVDAAIAKVASAQQDYNRQVSTLKAQIATQQNVIAAQEATVKQLQRDIDQARSDATAQQVQLEYYEIKAPITGIVGDIFVKVGDFVDSQTQLTSIRQNDLLEVQINIPIERLSQVRSGTLVEILSQETGELIGTSQVSYIAPSAGTGSQTILVKAIYDNRGNQLRTDQIVRAKVIWEQQSGITVPVTAISRIGDQSFVFIAQEQTEGGKTQLVAKQQPVKLGSIQGQSFEVLSGLKAGEKIVTDGVVKLRNGTPIAEQKQQPTPTSSSTQETPQSP